jgi:hypothetical protein
MHRISPAVPLNNHHSCCFGKQQSARAKIANFYTSGSSIRLFAFIQVSANENGVAGEQFEIRPVSRYSPTYLPPLTYLNKKTYLTFE